MTGDEKSTLEKLLELVASQSGLLTDGLQGAGFEVFVVIGDSHSESRIVKVSENVMSTGRVMNEKACPLQRPENSPWLQRGQAWGHAVSKAIFISSLT